MMKRLGTFALAAALAGSLTPAALAEDLLISPTQSAGYATAITLNGEKLDTAGLPVASGLPLRMIAEADHGSASWFEEENQGLFYLEGHQITVSFATGAVEVDGAALEGTTAEVHGGITFLPTGVLSALDGYTVTVEGDSVEITTPNSDPLVQLAYTVIAASDMNRGMKTSPADMEEYHGIRQENYSQVVGFFPLNVSPDTVIIGKLADGKLNAAKEEFEAYRKKQEDTFSWYLSQNLPKVQNAKVVEANGYVLFLIAEDADAGVAAFQEGVKGLNT